MTPLPHIRTEMARLDERLRPIAKRSIAWPLLMLRLPSAHPLDEADVRRDAERLLAEIIALYAETDPETRQALRGLFREHDSFAWAATLPSSPTTVAAFRDHLLLFSIQDQGPDARDAVIQLHHLCESARAAGLTIRPILQELAQISTDDDRYGMGSVKGWLLAVR